MSLSKTTGFAGIAAAVFMTGCATAPQTDTALQQELDDQRARVSELEATNARLRQQVQVGDLQNALAQLAKIVSASATPCARHSARYSPRKRLICAFSSGWRMSSLG